MTPSPVRVLIVDDEPICRKLIQIAMEANGYECDLAEDGIEAQQHLAQHTYDVVVTDLVMPRSNGGELVIQLCAQWPRPIVVVHSSVQEPEVLEGLKREGVDEILDKRASLQNIAERIQKLVELRQSHQALINRFRTSCRASRPAERHPVIRTLATGDAWIQSRPYRVEAFRFGIVILATLLFALGWGQLLTPETAGTCRMFGLCGLAFYFCLELVAYYREQRRARLVRYAAEQRLSKSQPLRADGMKKPAYDAPVNNAIA